MPKVETWLALHTLNMERILPIKSQQDFFAQKKNWQNGLQKSKKLVHLSLNILLPLLRVAAICRYDTWRWSRKHLGTDSWAADQRCHSRCFISYFFILSGHSSHKLIDCDVQSAFLSGTEYCCSTINRTYLVAAQCSTIFVWKFYEGPWDIL